jgi:L-malate glycosyltransferase
MPEAPPVRLLFLIGGLGPGGAELQARLLLTHLPRSRFSIRVGCFGGDPNSLAELEAAGISVEILPPPRGRLWPVQALRDSTRIIRRHRIQVVQTFLATFDMLGPFLRLTAPWIKLVSSRRSLDEYLMPREVRMLRLTGGLAHAIVGNSRAVAESVGRLEGHQAPRVRVIHNGIPLPPPIAPEERAAARRSLGLAEADFAVAYPAHFRRGKGHEFIPPVALAARSHIPQIRFLLAGDMTLSEGYRRTASALQNEVRRLGLEREVRCLGPYPNSRPVLAAADVSLCLSESEGMSNSVMESMALGVPVIATDTGGTPEIIRDERDGLLVPYGATEQAAERLVRVAMEPELRLRLGRAARERMTEDFSIERMAASYAALYQSLNDGSRKTSTD